jgi:MSHA biogenesis protein MshP
MKPILRRARGFALVLALFLIVSLAAIGTYMLSVSNVQVASGVMDEQGARAYQAARAGLDWGAYEVLRVGNCPGSTTIAYPGTLNLAGFYAEVTCTDYLPESEGGATVNTYRIVSTGCNATPCSSGSGATYVERQLQLTVTR